MNDTLDRRLYFTLHMAQRNVQNYADKVCKTDFDASSSQLAAIMTISREPGIDQTRLGEAMGLKKSAVTGLLNRMQERGLIRRESCPDDSRISRLSLTEQANALLGDIPPYIERLNREMTEGFSAEEIEVVQRFLNHLMRRFEP